MLGEAILPPGTLYTLKGHPASSLRSTSLLNVRGACASAVHPLRHVRSMPAKGGMPSQPQLLLRFHPQTSHQARQISLQMCTLCWLCFSRNIDPVNLK
jgi:hypothetical protein